MTVVTDSVVERYLEYIEKIEGLAPSTVLNRRYILLPFFRECDKQPQDMTIQDMDAYFMRRLGEVKRSSLELEKQAFRSFFNYCHGYLEMDLKFRWETIRRKKVKQGKVKTFSREEITQVLEACKETQDKIIISVMVESGMRIGEILKLRIEDISLTQIRVRGKGSNNRVVYISPGLAQAITRYKLSRGYWTGYLFRPLQKHKNHANDCYVSAYGIRDRIERAFAKCGHKMHPHQLRHTFAINWIEAGGDIRTLQILLGHSSIETTQCYLQLTDIQTQSIYNRVFTKSVLEYGDGEPPGTN